MSETIAVTGKSVKLFKGHYTSGGMEVGQHRSNELFRPPLSGRFLFCFAAPRGRQGQ
ncbi:MAG: hypothetical protein ACREYE_08915 [Gammaproteobacteria bacterium]